MNAGTNDEPLPRLEEVVEIVDPEPWLRLVDEHFGLAPELFADFVLFRANSRTIAIAPRRLELPAAPKPVSIGIPFLRTRSRDPKLSTAAIQRFGHLATRNTVDLDTDQLEAYQAGNDVELRPHQLQTLTGPGFVIVRHDGASLCMGQLAIVEERHTVRGQLPKSWSEMAG